MKGQVKGGRAGEWAVKGERAGERGLKGQVKGQAPTCKVDAGHGNVPLGAKPLYGDAL